MLVEIKSKLNEGRTAEIYEIDENHILKLFFPNTPKNWIEHEYKTALLVADIYKSAPKVYEKYEFNNRQGIIYERIYGCELGELLKENPFRCINFGLALADIHIAIHNIKNENLPSQKEIYFKSIEESRDTLGDLTNKLLEQLNNMKFDNSLCHGDLHLENIILSNGNYKVIDWMNASRGCGLADVCRSIIMLETPFSSRNAGIIDKFFIKSILWIIKNVFVKKYCKYTNTSHKEIKQYLAIVAAARIKENIPGEKEWLIKIIKKYI